MSILLPNAQQFVIIGEQLKDELFKDQPFKDYFDGRESWLKFIVDITQFNIDDYPNLTQTLFIIKHFDINPNLSNSQLSDLSAFTNNGYNNNHIVNTQDTCFTQEDSVGYTTDLDDIDEEPMQVQATKSDYDDGRCFITLIRHKCCIMGQIALLQTIRQMTSKEESIKMIPNERPLHNLAMQNTLITFSGIPSKNEAQHLLTLTRYMGAKSREDVTNKTTHLVAGNPRGIKYRRALELGLFIMSTNWVHESFRLAQDDLKFEASSPEIVLNYKLKPFHGLHMAFSGFKEDDVKELRELTIANEGIVVDPTSLSCTHVVVDAISGSDDTNSQLHSNLSQGTSAHVVYSEWFWASLEMEGKVSEDTYAVPGFRPQTRRASKKHRTSTGYSSFSNVLSPMLDYSRSPESISCMLERQVSRSHSVSVIVNEEPDLSKITARHRACLELLQTERNYVKILENIVKLFKEPLERSDTNDPILPMTDVKIIFGNLTPIYEVHKRMLSNLEILIESDWKETNCIGKVFVSHSIELLKAYPSFVNFFEDTKKTINTCDAKYPRFHAFLKRCQSKIECNRESLSEMIIRPVQRLPSISLIITELIKRTDDSNPDKKLLKEALESIRRVMNLINEDKRKTEGQIAMFDIVNNIEDCPPNLLSALRSFVCKAEAKLLFMNSESEIVPSKSHKVVLYLFSDLIEICKVRSIRRTHSIRRGTSAAQAAKLHRKEHRHLDELRLADVMNIYKNYDALVIQARPSTKYDQNFRYYPFVLDYETIDSKNFIEQLGNYVEQPLIEGGLATEEIDFGYANLLVGSMEKSRLSRVLSLRQALSPRIVPS